MAGRSTGLLRKWRTIKHIWDWLLGERNTMNVATFKSGWGDENYVTYVGTDLTGSICRLVTDFAVIN
ncbi:DUF4241 domain-containing protein [Flavitalea flava]